MMLPFVDVLPDLLSWLSVVWPLGPVAVGVWTTPRTYVAGEVHSAATLNTDHRDNLNAIQAGTVALSQVKIDGAASDPAVSPSGDAVIYHNSATNSIRASKNGGPFVRLDGSVAMAIIFGG